jgi:hypothetical protein
LKNLKSVGRAVFKKLGTAVIDLTWGFEFHSSGG